MAAEVAMSVLQKSLGKAKQYLLVEVKKPNYLRFHIRSLDEDIDTLNACESLDPQIADESLQLRIRARELRRELEALLLDVPEEAPVVAPVEATAAAKPRGTKLAPLKLPIFDGDATKFQLFLNVFQENVIQNSEVSDSAKWIRLKECLKSTPAELISELPETPDMLPVAIKMLDDVYGGDSRTVTQLYQKFQNLPVASADAASIRLIHSKLEGILRALERLEHDINKNEYLRSVYLGKFPHEIIEKVLTSKDTPLQTLRDGINKVLLARECIAQQTVTSAPAPSSQIRVETTANGRSNQRRNTNGANESRQLGPNNPPRCIFCGIRHWPDECPTYVTADERRKKAPDRCVRCLRFSHEGACVRERRCVFCGQLTHNRAFCPKQFPPASAETAKILAITEKTSQGTRTSWVRRKGCFLTMLTDVRSENQQQRQRLRVVIDTAGSRTLITKAAANKLNLKATEETFQYTGVDDDHVKESPAIESTFRIPTIDGDEIEIGGYIVTNIAKDLAAPNVARFRHEHPEFNHLPIPETGEGQPIDVLIGGDALLDLVLLDRGYFIDIETQLLATRCGWLIFTRMLTDKFKADREKTFLLVEDDHIKRMMDLEAVGLLDISQTDIEDEQKAINRFYERLIFKDLRYWISWPWREENPEIPSNFGLALGSLKSLHKRLQKHPQLLNEYDQIMLQQERDDVIEEINPEQADGKIVHYIPHHPVICPDKNTKIRVVYNGSAKIRKSERSLNDHILKGTKWLNDMTQVLLRFRKHKNALVSDIAKAFHQIGVNPDDRDAFRFLWLRDPKKPPTLDNIRTFRFKRVAFGIVASPFLLDATIKHHLSKQKKTPIILFLQRDLYADNLVTSVPEAIDVKEMYAETKSIFGSMSMNITKWATNNKDLENSIPLEDRSLERIQSVLGLRWDVDYDELSLKPPKQQVQTKLATKRNILSKTAAVFDPLGWAVPVVLMAKLLLRKIWSSKTRWDESVKQEMQTEWETISQQLDQVQKIELPRMYFSSEITGEQAKFSLHAFVDASAQAYAVVVFAVKNTEWGNQSSFVAAKSRLTPRKPVSIPRLELIAIRIGAKYLNYIASALQFTPTPKKVIWSDSKCALAWVRTERILPLSIQKQVEEIKKNEITQFRYVPSVRNKADVATRGASVESLQEENWWQAPSWLPIESSWPPNYTYEDSETEKLMINNEIPKQSKQHQKILEHEKEGVLSVKITEFSSLVDLFRKTETRLKAFRLFQKLMTRDIDLPFTVARILWIKWDQQREFTAETKYIGKRRIIVDEHGILRCQSRIQNAQSTVQPNPIILVKGSTLTKLIVLHIHESNCHVGTAHTLAKLSRTYYLPQARREIFKIIRNGCMKCRRSNSEPYPPPPPAPLPAFRVQKTERPFESIGMDIFGPFMVRLDKTEATRKQKRWVVIFTCAVIRAIHLEVITDMTTDEILGAFRRFVARRGVPKTIVCDNAPQFRVLNRKFENLWKAFASEKEAVKYFAANEIQWKFIPENSPWMGGMYERLIRSVKQAMEKTYGKLIIFHRQFEITIVEIEAVVNSRPLNYIDRSYEGPVVTPADFLQLKFPAIPISTDIEARDDVLTQMWRVSQKHLDQFWKDWSDYYLSALRERDDQLKNKTPNSREAPQPGDIVLMVDPSQKRSNWALALVERRIQSADGRVRAVQIKIANGTRMIRPVIKLAPLGVSTELPGVTDQQLNPLRDAIIVDEGEGAPTEQADQEEEIEYQDAESSSEELENEPESSRE